MKNIKTIPFAGFVKLSEDEMIERSQEFYNLLNKRRTIRQFSEKQVPFELIKNCIKTAGTAPSGANLQPWHFVVVSNPETKKRIREGAEKEEREFYDKRAPKEWLDILEPLGTDANKPFLETAPYLIAIFARRYELTADSKQTKIYYSQESVGIATGLLITAIHNAGLVSLTHTPSPMGFLNRILKRPQNEKPFLILVVGYPAESAEVPDIKRKKLEEIISRL